MYRTVISTKDNQILSLNGSKDEVETFILEQDDNVKMVRTMNKETGDLEMDLTFSN